MQQPLKMYAYLFLVFLYLNQMYIMPHIFNEVVLGNWI